MDLRQTVLSAMEARHVSRYKLIQLLKGKRPDGGDVPDSVVYKYLRGESVIGSDDLGLIMDVLGLSPQPLTPPQQKQRAAKLGIRAERQEWLQALIADRPESERQRILELVQKQIDGESTPEITKELLSLLPKKLGVVEVAAVPPKRKGKL